MLISELASSEILIFQLVSVAEQAGLNLTVRNPKTAFVAPRPIYFLFGKKQSYMFKLS